jgi:pimeloyl-ACP methyl ester carboxylesterase
MQTTSTSRATARVGAAQLYYQVRGGGAPVLLIPPIPGDAGHFDSVAAELAREHLVVTYDRRGNSRSPRPDGWSETSVAEQVEDAAGLLELVDRSPAVVYGTSAGAIVALELALARRDLVTRLVLHEMPLVSVLADGAAVEAAMSDLIAPAFGRGGPEAALDTFLRFAYGDLLVDALEPSVRERMYANGEVAMVLELPVFQPYRPDSASLRALRLPTRVLVGTEQQLPLFHEAAAWLADALGTEVVAAPGAHGPQFDRPRELAASIAA